MTGRGASGPAVAERARHAIPGGVNSSNRRGPGLEDLVVARARGARFWGEDGTEFVDFHCAGGPIVLGHCFEEVDRAAAARAAGLDLVGVARTGLEVELAEAIARHVPCAERVLLTMSGSEATYHALRLARAVTGRRYVLKFEGCYHGWHDSVAVGFLPGPAGLGAREPMSAGSMPEVLAATLVVPFNDAAAAESALATREVAAVIVEPIAHNAGAILPQPGFLAALRAICDRTGTVLVFDEVITGFRHAVGGMQRLSGVIPDLTTMGKAMANGYPIAALAGRASLMDAFTTTASGTVLFAGTYNGHPLAVAAAIETIEILAGQPVHEHLFALGARARDGLAEVFTEAGMPAVVAGFGSVFVTYFMSGPVGSFADLVRNDASAFVGYRLELADLGVFTFPQNLKRAHLSYSHTAQDVDLLLDRSRIALRRLAGRATEGAR